MANSSVSKPKTVEVRNSTTTQPMTTMSVLAPALGWLIPGAGHLIQKRWIRGLLFMFSITTMFFLGLAMQGRGYRRNGGDILDFLGFVDCLGSRGLFILIRVLVWGLFAFAHATAGLCSLFVCVSRLL